MNVYLAWTSAAPEDLAGPWHEARRIAPGLLLLESSETLSVVYHALKWALPQEASLIVSPVHQTPKSRGCTRHHVMVAEPHHVRRRPGGTVSQPIA